MRPSDAERPQQLARVLNLDSPHHKDAEIRTPPPLLPVASTFESAHAPWASSLDAEAREHQHAERSEDGASMIAPRTTKIGNCHELFDCDDDGKAVSGCGRGWEARGK